VLCGFGDGEWLAWELPCVALAPGVAFEEGSVDCAGEGVAPSSPLSALLLAVASRVAQYCST
jgi:hypothetical protein